MKYVYVLQENDLGQADKYAEVAMTADRYNPYGREHLVIDFEFNFLDNYDNIKIFLTNQIITLAD